MLLWGLGSSANAGSLATTRPHCPTARRYSSWWTCGPRHDLGAEFDVRNMMTTVRREPATPCAYTAVPVRHSLYGVRHDIQSAHLAASRRHDAWGNRPGPIA